MLSGNQTKLNSLPNDVVLAKINIVFLLTKSCSFTHPQYTPSSNVQFVTIASCMGQINIAKIVTGDKVNVSFYQ